MSTHVMSDDPANLTGLSSNYFDGTDASTAQNPGTFATPDVDETMLPAEEGAAGLVGPVTGAQHMPNAAQPGTM